MKRILFAIFVIMTALGGCQPAPAPTPPTPPTATLPPPTVTPVPPTATPTPVPQGIAGTVRYTGTQKGGLLILAMNQPPKPNEPPQAVKGATFADVSTGEFDWNLPPATYYLIAFFTIGRAPEGPTLPNEPLVFCNPIEVKADQNVKVEVVLTDADVGGKSKECLKK